MIHHNQGHACDPINDAISQLKHHEGFRSKPYRDSLGIWTIGYGLNLENGITEREASLILEERVRKLQIRLPMVIKFWHNISPTRQDVLINMAYNLGISGLLKFKKMLKALENKDYKKAGKEMLNSRWAIQVGDGVGQRAFSLAAIMIVG